MAVTLFYLTDLRYVSGTGRNVPVTALNHFISWIKKKKKYKLKKKISSHYVFTQTAENN